MEGWGSGAVGSPGHLYSLKVDLPRDQGRHGTGGGALGQVLGPLERGEASISLIQLQPSGACALLSQIKSLDRA